MKVTVLILFLCVSCVAKSAENMILISLDGVRWQDVYRGMDKRLFAEGLNLKVRARMNLQYGGDSTDDMRKKLMPFVWNTIAKNGVMIGNRDINSHMELSNDLWFSYPGYNELLTGKADPAIRANTATNNKNVTVLEWLNQQPKFAGKVAAFGSWDVFPSIVNESRSGVPVNAGFESASWPSLSEKAQWLNKLQADIPSPWHNVRLDAFTMGFAIEYLEQHRPRVLYIALGETDDFAHQGHYWQYLDAMNRADKLIAQLWQKIQHHPHYSGKTTLLITTDHGRGSDRQSWPHHGSPEAVKGYLNGLSEYQDGIVGANHVWAMTLGPQKRSIIGKNVANKGSAQTANQGELANTKPASLNQMAATLLKTLDIDYSQYNPEIGKPIEELQQ